MPKSSGACTRFRRWLAEPLPAATRPFDRTDARLPILVIGAGPAGLAAMAALSEAGIEFQAVESHTHVGGIWDQSNPLSTAYEGMQTVTSRFTTHLGPAMPSDWPDYVHHAQAREYLDRFAREQGLIDRIRFSTEFVTARKSPAGHWVTALREVASHEMSEQEYRAIVFCTGAHHRGMAAFPRELKEQALAAGIEVMHSAEYRAPECFAGKRVLIVGVGNSGSDIADRVSRVAQRTLLAIRTTPWINPQTALGVPCDKLAADTPAWLPEWWKLGSFHVMRRILVGGYRRLGLRAPKHGLNDRLPIGDRGIVAAIREGRVVVRSHVSHFADGQAFFVDQKHPAEPIDVAVFATGFARAYPLLEAASTDNTSVSDALAFLIFHREEPGLAYLAEPVGLRACWPIFVEQARAVAAFYEAEAHDAAKADAFNARRVLPTPELKGRLFRAADGFHVDYEIYTQVLRDLCAWLREV